MVLDIILYMILAWYLDAVVPGNGPPRSFLFPLEALLALRCGRGNGYTPVDDTGTAIELGIIREGEREDEGELAATGRVGLALQNVCKKYRNADRAALTNVSLELYEGQIFGLLGHNGAGKTTLHSIITGLLQPTSGRIVVDGQDLKSQEVRRAGDRSCARTMDDQQHQCNARVFPLPPRLVSHTCITNLTTCIRSVPFKARDMLREHLGVCPQHDILYEHFSVREHLNLFAAIKGQSSWSTGSGESEGNTES